MYFTGLSRLKQHDKNQHICVDMGKQRCICDLSPLIIYDLVASHDVIKRDQHYQHWFNHWLIYWWHRAFRWTNLDDSSLRAFGINLRAILRDMFKICIANTSMKIINSSLYPRLQGANELSSMNALRQTSEYIQRGYRGLVSTWKTRKNQMQNAIDILCICFCR